MLRKKTLDGHVESLLIGILLRRPNYGYQIVQDLNELAPDVLKMGEGTVYPVLHRMEKRGLLKAKWETADTGRPRKYYRVTRKGKTQFAVSQKQWQSLQHLMQEVFSSPASPETPVFKGATS